MTQNKEYTPLMQQYHDIKVDYVDTLLFFQVGDFYELFFDDAKNAAAFLGIVLTSRGKNKNEPIPLCGVPVHAIDHYLLKLVKGGFKVALCDQLEDPKPGTLVKRGVKQVLTPGTLTDSQLLNERSASYIFSFYPAGNTWGLIFSELLTAQIFITTVPAGSEKLLESELIRFFPDEILLPSSLRTQEFQTYFKRLGYFTTIVHANDEKMFESDGYDWLKKQFTQTVCAQLEQNESMRQALFYFYAYMSKNQRSSLDQFTSLSFYKSDDFLIMDMATQRNLELVKNIHDGSTKNTLFSVMDKAKTAMGSRMIKKWILRPLVKREAIIQRQKAITLFYGDIALVNILEQLLTSVGDCERIVGRIALQRASLMDYSGLLQMLKAIPHFRNSIQHYKPNVFLLRVIDDHLGDFQSLSDLLHAALHDEPSVELIIKEGFDKQLDHMRKLINNSSEQIIALEIAEQKATGIQSLKIRYNAIQGYYIEVTNTHLAAIPERYRRLQTLVGRERFIIPELQSLQYSIESARKDITQYEQKLFDGIKSKIGLQISALRKSAHAIANIDALLSLARLAYDNGYVCPQLNEQKDVIIIKGRHPVVEQVLSHTFIPNDTTLTNDQSLWIITGPNMGGKSTYLRQVALLSVMAHIGSFLPAKSANIALLDRIFTRIGASDNMAEGKSTFLVEMEETAIICTQATEKSLVILDEVGRGTSTFDGLAIAQAVVEYIFNEIGARCLFATHYHELTYLPQTHPGIVVYQTASKKNNDGILFLYTIIQGIADGSFGIEVAKLADLPTTIIKRSSILVDSFVHGGTAIPIISTVKDTTDQQNLYDENIALKAENQKLLAECTKNKKIMALVNNVDFDDLSPKKAFDLLWKCKDM
ncbi:MAG TPA: DNA mismatch repair protein MutS [Candidatus Babeliales bacterium]|nr:DNA mismatch repair protein MutS [Candidatus Babeliales bacterium]